MDPANSEVTAIGEVVAQRYELVDMIGRGGQGAVYRARDLQGQRDVAVKLIEGRAARDPETVERMAREQQALVALAGTHAVGFLDMCTSDKGALCLVMELLDGQDLESYLVARENFGEKLTPAKLIEFLGPIVTTLSKAHSVGIVHRDLKPGNIFLLSAKAGGGSRLLDFGFARLTDSRRVTRTGMVMGSPSYIAPEMWKGGDADQRADVYGFGVIVFRALTGELPFPNLAMHEILVAATQGKRPSLHARRPDLPSSIDAWTERVLATDMAQRFQTVRAAWDELLAVLEVQARPAATPGGTTPPPEVNKIKEWLEAPVSVEAEPLDSVWGRAAAALKRLVGASSPAPKLQAQGFIAVTPTAAAPATQPPKRLPAMPPPLRIAGLSATQPPSALPTAAARPVASERPLPTKPPPRRTALLDTVPPGTAPPGTVLPDAAALDTALAAGNASAALPSAQVSPAQTSVLLDLTAEAVPASLKAGETPPVGNPVPAEVPRPAAATPPQSVASAPDRHPSLAKRASAETPNSASKPGLAKKWRSSSTKRKKQSRGK